MGVVPRHDARERVHCSPAVVVKSGEIAQAEATRRCRGGRMSDGSVPIRRVAVVGAGTIGASWAAYFLSRGLEVAASDPAPNAEDFIRRTVEAAWPVLERLGLAPEASPDRMEFRRDPAEAVQGAE